MKRIAWIALAFAAPVLAQGSDALFAQMDRDHDGRVTQQEHGLAVRSMFAAMDADQDGRVTAAEMSAAQDKVGNKQADAMSSQGKIKSIDRNRDGVLTIGEHVSGARKMFSTMDKNRNGVLDRAEHAAGHAVLAKK